MVRAAVFPADFGAEGRLVRPFSSRSLGRAGSSYRHWCAGCPTAGGGHRCTVSVLDGLYAMPSISTVNEHI